MKNTLSILIFIFLLSCSDSSNKLEEKEQTIELNYISWACACANWASQEDISKYHDRGGLSDHCIFVEPADPSLKLSDTIGYSGDLIRFTGKFYVEKGIPKEFLHIEEPVDKAKIFRYTSYAIIKSGHKNFNQSFEDTSIWNIDKGDLTGKLVTIKVSYAAILCTCPQWFETKNGNDTINGRQHFYLERGKAGIVDANTLYNGSNLPIQLSLTGQFYDKEGYPKDYHPLKGNPNPAKVFRYQKLKILRKG